MKLEYLLFDPSGNVTVLVKTPVPVEAQAEVAARLMELEPSAEQAGFLSAGPAGANIGLRMAGGEFCGNATMSAAVWRAMELDSPDGRFLVDASGAPEPVPVDVTRLPDGAYAGSMDMPAPRSIGTVTLADGMTFPIVRFDGIDHLVLEQPAPSDEAGRAAAEDRIRRWCDELGAECLGVMYYDRDAGTLTPLVYAPRAGTLFWENACGSGSAAVGAYIAEERGGPVELSLREPGGTLTVTAAPDGALTLRGTVRFVKSVQTVLSG